MVWTKIDEEIIALEESDDDEVAPKAKKNVSMPSWMAIQMPLTTMQMIQKTKMHNEADPALSYDDENPDDEKK